jgi:hypothetical protein
MQPIQQCFIHSQIDLSTNRFHPKSAMAGEHINQSNESTNLHINCRPWKPAGGSLRNPCRCRRGNDQGRREGKGRGRQSRPWDKGEGTTGNIGTGHRRPVVPQLGHGAHAAARCWCGDGGGREQKRVGARGGMEHKRVATAAHLTGRGSRRFDLELVAVESEAEWAATGGDACGGGAFPWRESTAQLSSRSILCGYSRRRFLLPLLAPCSILRLPGRRPGPCCGCKMLLCPTYLASSTGYRTTLLIVLVSK